MRDVNVPQLGVGAALQQCGPLHHIQLGLETRLLELLGHDQCHVVVEVVLAAGEDADGFAFVASLIGLGLGFPGVVLVVVGSARLRIERRALGEVVALSDEEARITKAGGQHFAMAQRSLHGFARGLLHHRALFGVEHQVGEAERGCHDRHHLALRLFQTGQRLDGQQVGVVKLAGQRTFNACVGIGHWHETQLFHLGHALAAVAAGRVRAGRVAVKAREQHVLVGPALLEFVRAGAYVIAQRLRQRFLGHDGRHAGSHGQLRQQRSVGVFQTDLHVQRAFGDEVSHLRRHRLAARRHFHPALEAGHHVIGVEFTAAVQFYALAQGDGVELAVVRNLRHGFGQHGHQG